MITTIPRIANLPGAKPQWCWCEAIDSTNVRIWWSDRSSDEDLFDIERSTDAQTWQTLVSDLASTSKARNHTVWYRYSTFLSTSVEPPSIDNQISYIDTTVTPDTQYWYRVRAKKTGGVDASAWSRSWNYTVTPPDNILPARVINPHTTKVPNCQGTIHTPQNSAELDTLLDTVAFSRGDIIQLRHDVVYTGPFTFPRLTTPLSGNRDQDYVLVRTDNWQQLPDENERVSPGDADNMPKCTASTNNTGVFNLGEGASYYWFLGIHFDRGNPSSNRSNGLFDSFGTVGSETFDQLIVNNEPEVFLPDLMHNCVTIDRCYFYGGGEDEQQGMAVLVRRANEFAVINCYMENFKQTGEKQTILAFISYGPLLIQNNWLFTGSTMSFFVGLGGAPGMGISDVIVRRNVIGVAPKYDRRSISHDATSRGTEIVWTDVEIDSVNPKRIKRAGGATFANIRQRDMLEILDGTGFVKGRYLFYGGSSDLSPDLIELDRPAGTAGSTGGTLRAAGSWGIKNSFESKGSERMLFEENLFLGCPEVGQPGYKMFFGQRITGAPWERAFWGKAAFDVTVRWNYFTNYEGYCGFQIDDTQGAESAAISLGNRRVLYENNLFDNTLQFSETLFVITTGAAWPDWPGFTIRHNTFLGTEYPEDTIGGRDGHSRGAIQFGGTGVKWSSGSLIGNVFTIGTYGVWNPDVSFDLDTALSAATDAAVEIRDNVWIDVDGSAPGIPTGDVSSPSFDATFEDWQAKKFKVKAAYQGIVSPPVLRGQTDPGCDIDELNRRIRGVREGRKPEEAAFIF